MPRFSHNVTESKNRRSCTRIPHTTSAGDGVFAFNAPGRHPTREPCAGCPIHCSVGYSSEARNGGSRGLQPTVYKINKNGL